MGRNEIAHALADAARDINSTPSVEETLDRIVHAGRRSLSGIDHAAVTLAHADGTMEPRASTDTLVRQLDALQYELDEGPCVCAIRGHGVVPVEHLDRETRWPAFVARALKLGLRSQVGVQLYADEHTIGGLNLYSTSADTIDEGTLEAAELFAVHAALALGHAMNEEGLNAALATRKLIGQALGILMERYEIDEVHAFAFLVRASSRSNTKLRDVASTITDQVNARGNPGGTGSMGS